MKITGTKTFVVGNPPPHRGGRNWIIIKLTTDEGIVGYGEAASVRYKERTMAPMIDELAERFVIGADPFNIEQLFLDLYKGYQGFQHPDMIRLPIISAFEMACWDIVGKAVNQPVYRLLGGKCRDRLRAYSYMYGWEAGDPPELAAERALCYLDLGFTAIKIDPVMPPMPNPRELSLETLTYVENVVKAMRMAVGEKMDILLGPHGQMTTYSAIRLAQRLEPYNIGWLEEPVPPENEDEMAKVARSTSIPIATGERLSTLWDFVRLFKAGSASVIQIALGVVGGIMQAKKIAAMAEGHFCQIAPWLYNGPIAGAASIQLDVCSPNFLIQEGIETWGGFHAQIIKEPIRWERGYIIPPERPGLGVELDEEVAERYPFQPHPL